MERQRTLSERSFSSAESWELVKIEDHDKDSVPFLLENVENSIASDHSSVGHKSSTDSSVTNFTRVAELPMENGLSVEHSIESSEQNSNGSSTASSTDGSSAEMDATNIMPQAAKAQMPVAPLLLPNCPFPNFVEMKPRADEDDSLIESRVVHWLGLQRRQVGDSCSGIITNGPTAASPNRGKATTTTTVNSNNHYQTNKHIMTDPPFGLMAVLFSAMAITALLSIVEHFAWPGFQLLSSNYTVGGHISY